MEDKDLFRRYRETGDISLRNEIVEKYLYIASVIAKKFVGRGVEYDDLYQVAALALLKGVDRFDETKGLQFSTFITPTITGEIKNYFRDEYMTETGMRPTARELADRLGVSEEEVVRAAEAGSVVSLDKSVDDEEDAMSFYEVIPAEEDNLEQIETRDALESAFTVLTKEERELIEYRVVQELSQMETARRMNVSQMYVSRMERKVLNKLKERLKKSMAD